jgi:Type VI secretion system/phage-baseplate injector OB domain
MRIFGYEIQAKKLTVPYLKVTTIITIFPLVFPSAHNPPMQKIFKILASSVQANQQALDSVGRSPYPTLGVVVRNEDPDKERRVKISDPTNPGLESHWLRRVNPFPGFDPPLPGIGDTVLCYWVEGDPSVGFYQSIGNATNKPFQKDSASDDLYQDVPGRQECSTGKDRMETVSKTYTIQVGESFRLQNDAGAYIELATNGVVTIADAFGHRISLGSIGSALKWDLAGGQLEIVNASDMKISTSSSGGKSIASVGAPDTRGDTLVSRGW